MMKLVKQDGTHSQTTPNGIYSVVVNLDLWVESGLVDKWNIILNSIFGNAITVTGLRLRL